MNNSVIIVTIVLPIFFRTFLANKIGLPGHRNKRKGVFRKMYYFLYSNYKIIEQEMNEMAIQTHNGHIIFRRRNAIIEYFPDWKR